MDSQQQLKVMGSGFLVITCFLVSVTFCVQACKLKPQVEATWEIGRNLLVSWSHEEYCKDGNALAVIDRAHIMAAIAEIRLNPGPDRGEAIGRLIDRLHPYIDDSENKERAEKVARYLPLAYAVAASRFEDGGTIEIAPVEYVAEANRLISEGCP